MTAERGMLFADHLVRSILMGRKTETRRPLLEVLGIGQVSEFQRSKTPGYDWAMRDSRLRWNELQHDELLARCPVAAPGGAVYVREAHRFVRVAGTLCVEFRADGLRRPIYETAWNPADDEPVCGESWRPSIHMPKWAARAWLSPVEVGVERLQDITEEGAAAEGMLAIVERGRVCFEKTWNALYGEDSGLLWSANPYIWLARWKTVTDDAP